METQEIEWCQIYSNNDSYGIKFHVTCIFSNRCLRLVRTCVGFLCYLVEVTVVFNGGYYKSQRQNRPVAGLPLIIFRTIRINHELFFNTPYSI